MSFYDAIRVGASGAAADFEVERSVRFVKGDYHRFTRTPSSAGDRKTWTWSAWIKRGSIGNRQILFSADNNATNATYLALEFQADDNFRCLGGTETQSSQITKETKMIFRDTSAWYHLVFVLDATNSIARLYVNNSEVTDWNTNLNPSNQNYQINATTQHFLGRYGSSLGSSASNYFDGYMAEVNFIDGQALTPSSFGETNAETGQWNPIDTSGLTFGTNGFRLKFADNSGTTATTLGKDSSGNGNNFTPSNFVTGDAVKDSPTNNFITAQMMGTPFESGASFTEGNLQLTSGSTSSARNLNRSAFAPMLVNSGKWYAEFMHKDSSNSGFIGVGPYQVQVSPSANNTRYAYVRRSDGAAVYRTAGSETIATYGSSIAQYDVIGVYLDMDAGTPVVYFSKNGQWADGSGNFDESSPTSGITLGDTFFTTSTANSGFAAFIFSSSDGGTSVTIHANFGQDSTFAGQISAGGNVDANSIGDFKYAVPTGAKALCSANLPDPTILLPNKHFDTLLWTANASTQVVTGLNFQPDWVWGKSRDDTYDHEVYDSVRGPLKRLKPNATDQELTNAGNLQSFNSAGGGTSGGFTLGSATNMNYNSGSDIVGWNWNGGDTDSATYRVVVVSDSGNKYRFRNSANTATFAQSAVVLDLAEGGTYTFDQSDSTMSSHPMKLSTTANGTHGGGTSYNTGVTYQLDGATVTESAFVSGFSSATSRKLIITVAASAPTLYYYCHYHSGMGSSINTNSTLGSSNFDGSTQTIVKANTTAGFSIVSYSGNDTSGSTIGHGLGAVPQITIIKRRIAAEDWMFGIGHILGSGKEGHYIKLNATESEGTGNGPFASTNSSSTVVTIGSDVAVNDNGEPYICYCFSEVAGYSKFGLYRGNGNADGTFIFTGFRPAFFICKAISFTKGWRMTDSKRAPFNRIHKSLFPELTAAEYTATGTSEQGQDFFSNGVKLRSTNTRDNQSGSTYFFMAFAESPFKNSRAR